MQRPFFGGGGSFSGGTVPNNTTFSGNVIVQGTLDVTGVVTFTTTVVGGGQFSAIDGTKTAPSYSNTGDLDTGIYFPAANEVAVSCGDTLIGGWSSAGYMVTATLALGFTGRGQFKSPADGIIEIYATDGSTRGRLRTALGSAASPAVQYGDDDSGDYSTSAGVTRYTSFNATAKIRTFLSGNTPTQGVSYPRDWSLGWIDTTGSVENTDAIATGFIPAAAGVLRLRAADTTSPGAFLCSTLVEANVAGSGSPNILLIGETRTLLTNEGATAENYHTLPLAAAGLTFTFFVQDTDGIRITANTADTIRVAAGVSGAAGFVRCATQGAIVRLTAINATEWVAEYQTGVWTVDV